MKEVQPIRNMEKIQEIKKRLAQNGTRDVLLFSNGSYIYLQESIV